MTRKSWRWSFSEHSLCPLKPQCLDVKENRCGQFGCILGGPRGCHGQSTPSSFSCTSGRCVSSWCFQGRAGQPEESWPAEGQHPPGGPPSFLPWGGDPAMPSKRPLVGWHGHLEIGRAGRKVDSEATGELRGTGEMQGLVWRCGEGVTT